MLGTVGPAAQALEKALRAVDTNLAESGTTSAPPETPVPAPASEGQKVPGTPDAPAAPQQKPEVQTTDSETQQRPTGAAPSGKVTGH
jgi:hypothetical protein